MKLVKLIDNNESYLQNYRIGTIFEVLSEDVTNTYYSCYRLNIINHTNSGFFKFRFKDISRELKIKKLLND